jgi:hypothetical protein
VIMSVCCNLGSSDKREDNNPIQNRVRISHLDKLRSYINKISQPDIENNRFLSFSMTVHRYLGSSH